MLILSNSSERIGKAGHVGDALVGVGLLFDKARVPNAAKETQNDARQYTGND